MLKTMTLLARGIAADNAQAVQDAHAVAVLRQQVRDAAAALAIARRELALAMAYRDGEAGAIAALTSRIDTLSDGARKALADGRDDLGREAAIVIAALEDERADREASAHRFAGETDRLGAQVAHGQARLREIDRGLQSARVTEALRRAGGLGQRGYGLSTSALDDAESTLARLRERQRADDAADRALASLERHEGLEARLDAAGYGTPRTSPQDILIRLKKSA